MAVDANANGAPPGTFPQVGYLREKDGASVAWPLYGQQASTRRGRWNYYTIAPAAAGGGVKLPVQFEGRDCTEEVACQEISDGEMVAVPDAGLVGLTARMYRRPHARA